MCDNGNFQANKTGNHGVFAGLIITKVRDDEVISGHDIFHVYSRLGMCRK